MSEAEVRGKNIVKSKEIESKTNENVNDEKQEGEVTRERKQEGNDVGREKEKNQEHQQRKAVLAASSYNGGGEGEGRHCAEGD